MDRSYAQTLIHGILGTNASPPLVSRACELEALSRSRVALKAMEEVARPHACCWLACEASRSKANNPAPLLLPPGLPLPPVQFRKLLEIFRRELALPPPLDGTATALGRSPSRSASVSPRKKRILANPPIAVVPDLTASPSPSKSRRTRANDVKLDESYDTDQGDDDESFSVHSSLASEDESDRNYSSRLEGQAGNNKRSAQPPTQKPSSATDRSATAVVSEKAAATFLDKLPLTSSTKTAINVGFRQYKGLVKDQYGLLAGVTYVVAHRAEDVPHESLESEMQRAIPGGASEERIREWIHWAKKIVVGQLWIEKVAVRPETLRKVRGGPGAWSIT